MTPNNNLPTLSMDGNGGWELILPACVLPVDITNITVSDDGIYLETAGGDYDLVTFDDLVEVMVLGRLGRVIANGNGHWPSPTVYFVEDSPGVIPLH